MTSNKKTSRRGIVSQQEQRDALLSEFLSLANSGQTDAQGGPCAASPLVTYLQSVWHAWNRGEHTIPVSADNIQMDTHKADVIRDTVLRMLRQHAAGRIAADFTPDDIERFLRTCFGSAVLDCLRRIERANRTIDPGMQAQLETDETGVADGVESGLAPEARQPGELGDEESHAPEIAPFEPNNKAGAHQLPEHDNYSDREEYQGGRTSRIPQADEVCVFDAIRDARRFGPATYVIGKDVETIWRKTADKLLGKTLTIDGKELRFELEHHECWNAMVFRFKANLPMISVKPSVVALLLEKNEKTVQKHVARVLQFLQTHPEAKAARKAWAEMMSHKPDTEFAFKV